MKARYLFALCLVLICCLWLLLPFGFAAEAVAVVPAVATVSLLDWFKENSAAILGLFLGISELMGASPWFKGNGLLDTIIKSLKFLLNKDQSAA